ncbi:nucleic acid-binding protein [Rostrohypoxylon terebratum]|nr:nucleic acid-binding protein [Rostrohypoxylon terebratum]
MATEVAAAAASTTRQIVKEMLGVVVSAGLMDKTVKVKLGGFRWEPRVQKYFKEPRFKLVHDPRNSVRQGDIVAITPTWRVSQHVRHVVKHIIAPYGEPIDERPPIPTLEERVAEAAAKRAAKDERRALLKQIQAATRKTEKITAEVKKALRTFRRLGFGTHSAPEQPEQPAETTINDVD